LNHFLGLVANEGAYVDMAAGIAITGTLRDVFLKGVQAGIDSVPTLVFVAIGAAIGGITAVAIEKMWAERDAAVSAQSKDISM